MHGHVAGVNKFINYVHLWSKINAAHMFFFSILILSIDYSFYNIILKLYHTIVFNIYLIHLFWHKMLECLWNPHFTSAKNGLSLTSLITLVKPWHFANCLNKHPLSKKKKTSWSTWLYTFLLNMKEISPAAIMDGDI